MAEPSLFSNVESVPDAVKTALAAADALLEEKKKAVVEAEEPLQEVVSELVAKVKNQFPSAEFQFLMGYSGKWQLNILSPANIQEMRDLVRSVTAKHTDLRLSVVPVHKDPA